MLRGRGQQQKWCLNPVINPFRSDEARALTSSNLKTGRGLSADPQGKGCTAQVVDGLQAPRVLRTGT
jgi:hypothetical protein